jgi:anthranilate synthase/aminodeoxychorismate synthase-like glutamine amidotransferase
VPRCSGVAVVLLIDNYDSFTYNLVQYIGELGAQLTIRRNDEGSVEVLAALRPSHIVISPGPGRPEDAGMIVEVIQRFGAGIPILGVCLGHQAIAIACGGQVVRAGKPVHGKISTIDHDGRGLFAGIEQPLSAARYHSLVIKEESLPADLEVAGRSREDSAIMAVRHRTWPVHGVQFHPESILTRDGRGILRNFLAV